jgi:hypothetical protein
MKVLTAQLGDRAILLWLSENTPPQADEPPDLFINPTLITAGMVAAVMRANDRLVCALPSQEARAMGLEGMSFDPAELPIAASLPGPFVHREVCNALLPHIEDFLGRQNWRSDLG